MQIVGLNGAINKMSGFNSQEDLRFKAAIAAYRDRYGISNTIHAIGSLFEDDLDMPEEMRADDYCAAAIEYEIALAEMFGSAFDIPGGEFDREFAANRVDQLIKRAKEIKSAIKGGCDENF